MSKLKTENYKGTRDFFPEEMKLRTWMFGVMKKIVQTFGYEEYDGPLLESLDIYKAKSGEEIVNRQLYNFTDKGGREVAIRPEMTPTLARMVASKSRELAKPIRWYSIPNLWRYEAPGHGRLREHWQLNVDLFGVTGFQAEVEIVQLACEILFAFGATSKHFKVRFSNRKVLNDFLGKTLGLEESKQQAVAKILDKKNKISVDEFNNLISEQLNKPETDLRLVNNFLNSTYTNLSQIAGIENENSKEIEAFQREMNKLGYGEVVMFDPSIIRGFDYYTGFIFEIFDTSPENKRSLYGGGRYDNLIGLFSNDELSGIGFGLGDVTLENFLRTHNLIPSFKKRTGIFACIQSESCFSEMAKISTKLRRVGLMIEMNLDGNLKLGKQIANAEKKGYEFVLIMGEEELKEQKINLKNLVSGEQKKISIDDLQLVIQSLTKT
ncbi:MAG: histidine--tRNA ligase [Leptospiraceae bacterium]|nr:histidine--tRNA ligase [Leptospiraceae bacterium]